MNTVVERIEQKLAALTPAQIDLRDESEAHAGHPGAARGGGHYRLIIVSPRFSGKSTQLRHRMVYSALGDMMQREIHALSIKAYAPDEIKI
ncbi:MAG TPA: BolA family protein [Burkholderiales bacterium]|nr:BolA family protein [Burkholderiales bacterium]